MGKVLYFFFFFFLFLYCLLFCKCQHGLRLWYQTLFCGEAKIGLLSCCDSFLLCFLKLMECNTYKHSTDARAAFEKY